MQTINFEQQLVGGKQAYTVKKFLGRGSGGTVMLCVAEQTQQKYAIKQVPIQYVNEYNLAKYLIGRSFKNIVNFIDVFQVKPDDQDYFVVMDYCNGPSLFSELYEEKKVFDEKEACQIILDVSKGLQNLHDSGIIHRDVKPENIVSHKNEADQNVEYKVCDFGTSKKEDLTRTMGVGTIYYMAPEVIHENNVPYGPKIDVWSLGLVLYEMITGETFFQGTKFEMADQILKMNVRDEKFANFSDQMKALLCGMIDRDPDRRFNMNNVIKGLEYLITGKTKKKPYIINNDEKQVKPNELLPPEEESTQQKQQLEQPEEVKLVQDQDWANLKELQSQRDNLEQENENSITQKNKILEQMEETKQQINEKEKQLQEIGQTLTQDQNNLQLLIDQNQAVSSQIQDLQAKLTTLNKETEDQKQQKDKLYKELDIQQSCFDQEQKNLRLLIDQNQVVSSQIQDLQTKLTTVNKETENQKLQKDTLEEELNILQQHIALVSSQSINNEFTELSQQIQLLKDNLQEEINKQSKQTEEQDLLSKQQSEYQLNIQQLKEDVSSNIIKLKKAYQDNKQIKQELDTLVVKSQNLNQSIQKVEKQLNEKETEIKEKKKQLSALQDTLSKLEQENRKDLQINCELEQETLRLEKDIHNHSDRLKELKKKYQDAKVNQDKFVDQSKNHREERIKLENAIEKLQINSQKEEKLITIKQKEIDDLNIDVSELEYRLKQTLKRKNVLADTLIGLRTELQKTEQNLIQTDAVVHSQQEQEEDLRNKLTVQSKVQNDQKIVSNVSNLVDIYNQVPKKQTQQEKSQENSEQEKNIQTETARQGQLYQVIIIYINLFIEETYTVCE